VLLPRTQSVPGFQRTAGGDLISGRDSSILLLVFANRYPSFFHIPKFPVIREVSQLQVAVVTKGNQGRLCAVHPNHVDQKKKSCELRGLSILSLNFGFVSGDFYGFITILELIHAGGIL